MQLGGSTAEIRVRLHFNDYLIILQTSGLWDSSDTAYLSVDMEFLQNISGHFIEQIPTSNATLASDFMGNTASPSIDDFEMDMDAGILTVVLDDGLVNTRSINYSRILLQRSNMGVDVVSLEGSIALTLEPFSFELRLLIGKETLNKLKQMRICSSETYCWGEFNEGAFVNPSGVSSSSATPAMASSIQTDISPVVLLSFSQFNLSNGHLILSFSEPVNTTTLLREGVFFTDSMSGAPVVPLTQPLITVGGENISDTVELLMQASDLASVHSSPGLCSSRETCYLALPLYFIADTSHNLLVHSLETVNSPIGFYRPEAIDGSPFMLVSFALDLNVGVLQMTFSEPLAAETFRPDAVSLQNKASNSSQLLTLRDSAAAMPNDDDETTLVVALSEHDLNEIKVLVDLATSHENTYVSIDTFAGKSRRNVCLAPIDTSRALPLRPGYFRADSTSPRLTGFEFSHDTATLILTFSEPVRIPANVDALSSAMRLISNTASPTLNISLHGLITSARHQSTSGANANTELVIGIETELIMEIQNLATVFISIGEGNTILDYNNNKLVAVQVMSVSPFITVQPTASQTGKFIQPHIA